MQNVESHGECMHWPPLSTAHIHCIFVISLYYNCWLIIMYKECGHWQWMQLKVILPHCGVEQFNPCHRGRDVKGSVSSCIRWVSSVLIATTCKGCARQSGWTGLICLDSIIFHYKKITLQKYCMHTNFAGHNVRHFCESAHINFTVQVISSCIKMLPDIGMVKVYPECVLKAVNVDHYIVTEYTSLFLDFFHQLAFPCSY